MAQNSRNKTSDAFCRDPLYTAAITCGVIQLMGSVLFIIAGIVLRCVSESFSDSLEADDLDGTLESLKAESRLAAAVLIIMGFVGVGLTGMLINGIRERNLTKLVVWNILAGLSLLSVFRVFRLVRVWYAYPVPIISLIITVMFNVRVSREQQEGLKRFTVKV